MILKIDKNHVATVTFWTVASVFLFWGLGQKSLWGGEDRWAEIVRAMLLTRDFFHPSINGLEYFDKPLLSYWLIALASAITGKLNELSVRLPSAMSGMIVLWATVRLGKQLWSAQVGRTAGWLLVTSYALIFWARDGMADMQNLAAIITAVAWYWHRRQKPGFLTYLVFYLICFIGAHTKGLAAVIVPVLAILPDLLRQYRWKAHLKLSHALALLIGCILYFTPFVIASTMKSGYHTSGIHMVFRENILRYFEPFDHKEPFYVYFQYVPSLLLPWTPLFVGALLGGRQLIRAGNQNTRWLVETIIIIFVFFTLSGSRRNYYILPIIPFCALYISVFLHDEGNDTVKRIVLTLQGALLSIIAMVELLSPALWPVVQKHVGFVPLPSIVLFTPVIGLLALSAWLYKLRKTNPWPAFFDLPQNAGIPIIMAVILMGGFFCWQHIALDVYRTSKPFALELKSEIVKAGLKPRDIAFYGKHAKDVVFYLDLPEPIRMLTTTEQARSFLNSAGDAKLIIARRDCQDELLPLIPPEYWGKPILRQTVHPWEENQAFSCLTAWKIERGTQKPYKLRSGRPGKSFFSFTFPPVTAGRQAPGYYQSAALFFSALTSHYTVIAGDVFIPILLS
jgi:4-amino-4-deoxy-L-arabinose transferase-like glycosyltransferase